MKRKLLLLAAMAFVSVSSFGQTTLFEEFFDPATFIGATELTHFSGETDGTVTGFASGRTITGLFTVLPTASTPSGGWTKTHATIASGRSVNYTAASGGNPESYNTFFSIMGSSQTTPTTLRGTSTASISLSNLGTGFNPILTNNNAVITWSFGFRINRSTKLTNLATAFTPGAGHCGGVILATNMANNSSISTDTNANGYAVIMAGDDVDATNSVYLGYFTGGLSTGTFTVLSKVSGVVASSSNGVSVIVDYNPVDDTWSMKVRKEGTTAQRDPYLEYTPVVPFTNATPATVINTTHTSITNVNMMMYYNCNAGNAFLLDNLRVKKGVPLSVTKNEIEGLKIYPNPVKEGKLFISSNSAESKSVAIYDILGKQVLAEEVTAGYVNVSALIKGVYVLKITEAGKTSTRKIVIE
ncbi:T9SS type A sorting domain-containing protein [Flavobacterium sp. UMI-01]|uniref:T9SS type A sorting domain-containing protein n=1 Tax=Flavobacterium sp. UMI-01 TaxID=1441053 RepID=UPI001C7CA3C7|nr:T9SS type A sorting domain-containing protein [Flavobacterium sp. UMI-01]GIZ07770.1 hypothetical protein FUMI01_04970 [Flavobacterium sp. UMI-01]